MEDHHEEQQGTADRRELDDEPPPTGCPVDERPDEWGDDREGGEADEQVEQHLAARRVGADREEQRAGERHDIATSPAVISAWVRARRLNGET